MLKNSKDFKRKVFSNISKAKVTIVKIGAICMLINSITLTGIGNSLISVKASTTNTSTIDNDTEGDALFIPANKVASNVTINNKEIVCSSTAYTGGGRTASGMICERDPDGLSTISVDPNIIPLGTIVYIEGYGYAVAADTGGAVKGQKVDVYFNSVSECYAWGNKSVKVIILGDSSNM